MSALRKLRTRPVDVNFVYVPREEHQRLVVYESVYVVYPFLRGRTTVRVGGYADGQVLLPERMRAAVIPDCLLFKPGPNNVMFEPGTAFTKSGDAELYEQLKPHQEKNLLLFPPHAFFPPLTTGIKRP